MRFMLPVVLAALGACTADPQGEHRAAASSCGAADVKGIIGYSIDELHLPHGTDRIVQVEGHHASYGHRGYHGGHKLPAGDHGGYSAAAHHDWGHDGHRTARKGEPGRNAYMPAPPDYVNAKMLWLGDPYRMNVLVDARGVIIDVICY